jgi:tryptophanyl-tRNA synthetase
VDHFDAAYNNCSIRYGDLKKQLAEDIISFTEPLRDKILSLSGDEVAISKAARIGADKARESARKTIREVREIIGFRPF